MLPFFYTKIFSLIYSNFMSKKFLHIGCGPLYKDNTTPAFNSDEWEEVRLDIDPAHNPDIVCSMTEMTSVDDNSFDAIYSSHNIEHIFPHEVVGTFEEFRRVLKDDGFLILTCPDIKAVCALIGEGKVGEKLYTSLQVIFSLWMYCMVIEFL